jgi:hypothetical protein
LLEGGSNSDNSSELTRKSSKDICKGDTTFDDDIEEKNHIIMSDGDKGKGNTYDDNEQRSNVKNCPTIEIPTRRNSLSAREERQKRLEHARAHAAKHHTWSAEAVCILCDGGTRLSEPK